MISEKKKKDLENPRPGLLFGYGSVEVLLLLGKNQFPEHTLLGTEPRSSTEPQHGSSEAE